MQPKSGANRQMPMADGRGKANADCRESLGVVAATNQLTSRKPVDVAAVVLFVVIAALGQRVLSSGAGGAP